MNLFCHIYIHSGLLFFYFTKTEKVSCVWKESFCNVLFHKKLLYGRFHNEIYKCIAVVRQWVSKAVSLNTKKQFSKSYPESFICKKNLGVLYFYIIKK